MGKAMMPGVGRGGNQCKRDRRREWCKRTGAKDIDQLASEYNRRYPDEAIELEHLKMLMHLVFRPCAE